MSGKAFRKILLIVSHQRTAEKLKEILVEEGYSLHLTESGEEGLEKLKLIEPDLVLLDLVLPDIGGFEVCRRIRKRRDHGLPIIMVGHGKNFKLLAKGLNEGADDFIYTPFEPEELAARINVVFRWLEGREELEEKLRALRETATKAVEQNEELRGLTKRLRDLSIEDEATGIHHVRYFQHRLQEEIGKIERHGGILGCIRLSVDNMADILEQFGLAVGERIVAEVGRLLCESLRVSDVPTRLSHSDFAILVVNTSKEHALLLAQRIFDHVRALAPDVGDSDGPLDLQVSVGLACFPEDTENVFEVGSLAERALRNAQRKHHVFSF